jgi:GNAT superfamily N-acetyltransferase
MAAAWVALAEGVAVGHLLALYVFSLELLGLTAEVDEFSAVPEHRHRGVGTALLEVAEATFAAAGCTNVFPQVWRQRRRPGLPSAARLP